MANFEVFHEFMHSWLTEAARSNPDEWYIGDCIALMYQHKWRIKALLDRLPTLTLECLKYAEMRIVDMILKLEEPKIPLYYLEPFHRTKEALQQTMLYQSSLIISTTSTAPAQLITPLTYAWTWVYSDRISRAISSEQVAHDEFRRFQQDHWLKFLDERREKWSSIKIPSNFFQNDPRFSTYPQ